MIPSIVDATVVVQSGGVAIDGVDVGVGVGGGGGRWVSGNVQPGATQTGKTNAKCKTFN